MNKESSRVNGTLNSQNLMNLELAKFDEGYSFGGHEGCTGKKQGCRLAEDLMKATHLAAFSNHQQLTDYPKPYQHKH